MIALSILQPYAWLIANGHKDIENRTWATRRRGAFLIHAGKRYAERDYWSDVEYFYEAHNVALPAYAALDRGGVVGVATIAGCVTESNSEWFHPGGFGFVIQGASPLPFRPWRGQLGFFDIPA